MMYMLNKKIKQCIAKTLIFALIFSTNSMYSFADSVESIVEEYVQEENTTTAYDEVIESTDGIEEDIEEENEDKDVDEEIAEESEESVEENDDEPESDENVEETEETETEETEEELESETNEIETEETESEIDEIIDIASDSDLIEVAPMGDLLDEDMMPGLFGDIVNQKVILDFGFGPQFDESTNWDETVHSDAIAKFTHVEGDSKYSITGQSSTLITDYFTGTEFPGLSYGSGNHVQLPAFDTADNAVWEGYKFVCWEDEEGRNLTNEQNGTFLYAFQNTGDVTYTAHWEKVENLYDLHVAFVSERTSTQSTVFEESDEAKVHRTNVYVQPSSIPGFMIDRVSPRVNGAELPENPLDALKTLSYNGIDYLDMSDEDIQVDGLTHEVQGAMPNHPLDINVCYKPDPETKYKFTINYINIADGTTNVSPQNVQYLNVETLLDYKPLDLPNYRYEEAVVECGPRSILTHAYELGFFTLDGQIISPTDKTDESDNQGRFYTLMPNQELTLTYKYSLISDHAEITVNKHIQQRNGSYTINTEVIDVAPSTGEITGSFVLENKEDEGYGTPIITIDQPDDNPTLFVVSYVYHPGLDGEDGEYKFYTKDYTNRTIDVVYSYDFNSSYWGQVEYHAYNTPEGHGYIQAATDSMPLDTRYFKRGTYTINDLLEDVDIVPEENYMFVVYKNNLTTPGPILPQYTLDSEVELGSALSLFINFEPDPDKWIDIYFQAAPQSSISGENHIYVPRTTPVASLSFPTVTTETGYMHMGGYWQDAAGNLLADPLSAITESYIYCSPVIVSVVGEYSDAVKPLVYTEYNSNGRGTAYLYTRYQTRNYILTDRNEKILVIKNGSELENGFTGLYPGTTYHLYEMLAGTPLPSDGIMTPGVGISEKCVFGVNSVGSNYNYDETNSKISITPAQGVSYALLDDKYNIAHAWTTIPQFPNLANGTYYLIVAKQNGDTILENDENAIRNGVVVFTEKVDLSTRYCRLILIGQNAMARNMTDIVSERSGTGANTKKVYSLPNDRPVTLTGATNAKWQVCSENATLTSMTSQMPTSFVMPSEDTIIRNYIEPSLSLRYKTEYHTAGTKMAFLHEDAILTKLNQDENITNALAENAIIKHYVVVTKRPTSKQVVDDLDTKIAPYEYGIEVISEVNEKPYPNSKVGELDLSAFFTFEESVVGNEEYELTSGTFDPLYNTTEDTDIGSGIITLSATESIALKYKKVHRIEIKRQLDGSMDDSVNDIYFVSDNKKMSESIANYSTEIQNRFSDYFDMSGVTQESVSTYNAKEYIYQGVYADEIPFDATNSIIKKKMGIVVRYALNNEREYYKELLSLEINGAVEKENSLVTQSLKNILSAAIVQARGVKDTQKDYTVEEIINEYETLHDLVQNTNDPPQSIEIILDANGGVLSADTITVYKGNEFTFATLSNVSKSREGYNFLSWNTAIDGLGTIIAPNTIVGNEPPTVLYAIWQAVNNNPTPSRGGSNSGGGGGGGGSRPVAQVGDQILVKPSFENPLEFNKKVLSIDAAFPGFTNSVIYSDEKVHPYYIYDQFNNVMSLHFINTENNETMTSQWFTYERHIGNEIRHQTHLLNEAGVALTGFQLVDNTLYYLNEKEGEHYSTLKTGWIHDEKDDKWFYASDVTGAILTGWQNIDGKDYYFVNNRTKGEDGKEYITENNVKNDFGVMLKNCVTPDGYALDENGARIIIKP